PRRAHAVLANLSAGYSPPLGRFRSVTHPFAARQHVLLRLLPLDLHVLGTPPAFNLSQDQTLHLKILKSTTKSKSKNSSNYCWTSLVTRSCAKGTSTRVPTQITCQTFKEHPRALKASGNHARTHGPGPHCRPRLRGARSIAPQESLSTHCHLPARFLSGKAPRSSGRPLIWGAEMTLSMV